MRVFFFLILVFYPFISQAQQDPLHVLESMLKEGAQLETSGNFASAIGKYKQAEVFIQKNKLGKSYEALTGSLIGYAYYNSSKYDDALKYLKHSAHCYEADTNTLHLDYCMLLHDIAALSYYSLHQPADSLCLYAIKAVNCAYEIYGESDPNFGRFLDLVGMCKIESKDYAAAKPILLYAYQLLEPYRDSLPSDFLGVCGHLATLYNWTEQQDSSMFFAMEKLKQAKKFYGRKDPNLAEAYFNFAFALNVGNIIDSSIIYLDSAQAIYPKVCQPKEKAEFYYRGGVYCFGQKDLVLAKHYFIQSGTYLANNKISNSLEGSCWLWVAGILLTELKITEAKPYCDKACEFFKKYKGAQDNNTQQVCQMADGLTKMDITNIDLKSFFPDIAPDDLKEMLSKMTDPTAKIAMGNDYLRSLLAEGQQNPNFKELPRAMEAALNKRYNEVIEIIQHYYVTIIPGYQDSLNYYSDPNINSPTIETNYFLLAMLLKATAYDALGAVDKDLKKLKYAWHLLEKCDTLMSNIRINAANEDVGMWGGALKGIYEQMILTSGKLFDATQEEAYYDKTLFASERLKAFALLNSSDPARLKSLIPAKILSNEKQLVEQTLQLRRDLAKSRSLRTFTKEEEKAKKQKERLLQDSLFHVEANLATIRSDLKVRYPKYWEAKNEKKIASVREVMEQLDARTAIISYTCMMGESVSILVITNTENSFIIDKPLPDAKAMVATISDYVAGKQINKADYTKAANSLYRDLIVNLPATIEQLIIIPDGFLHDLPFEALLTKGVNANASFAEYPFLLKRYAVSYGYSATLVCDQLKNKSKVAYPSFLLGYGAPEYNDFKAVIPICDAKGLKCNIRDKFDTSTKTDFLGQNLRNYQIVHITAHGRKTTQTDVLGILLAGGEQVYYADLYKLDINADLFLLLACLSGKGNVVTGEGVIGLNRALYAAGARNVLLYRDELNNETNTFFCKKFYEQITTNKALPYSVALQQARIAMINSSTFADPIHWAGYYLIGH